MQYLGGKHRIARRICEVLISIRGGRPYTEPFVGGGSVLFRLDGQRFASDVSESLINMYIAIQDGWEPPDTLSEGEYNKLKNELDSSNPMTAFAGYGCSFGGKYFAGYARGAKGRNYALSAKRALLRDRGKMKDVVFKSISYNDISCRGHLIYCDPPYRGTTGYGFDFNHDMFWAWARRMAKTNTVLVSEYTAPAFAIELATFETKTDIRTKSGGKEARTERLFSVLPD
jgi:DNA adenine methylase